MKFNTLCLHSGQEIEPSNVSRAVPIHRTSSYLFKDTEQAANLFALKEFGNIYSRLTNPTTSILETRMAALEGGVGAVAVASGMSAAFYAVVNICTQGDEILSAPNLYGGTFNLFKTALPRFGINTNYVDFSDLDLVKKSITEKTKLLYVETIGNPSLDVPDFEGLSKVAHDAGIPLVVDNTFATPYLCRPFEYGADVVLHSLTKWLGGHGTGIGGVVVDSGKFDWGNGNFPLYSEPDPAYHNMVLSKDLPQELRHMMYILRLRIGPLRTLGACLSPDNAWMFLQGIETLPLRKQRHIENALKVAQYLESNENIAWVNYPGLESDPSNANAKKYLKGSGGSVVVCGLKGGRAAGETFINSLELVSHLANVGDAKTLALHPASTSHSQLSEEELAKAGVKPELVRLSIGIEDIDDIIADLEQAITKAS